MGFKKIGKHKTKLIKLFMFDEVKIIINYENSPLVKEGRKQGPYPYAYGLKVEDLNLLLKKTKLLIIYQIVLHFLYKRIHDLIFLEYWDNLTNIIIHFFGDR